MAFEAYKIGVRIALLDGMSYGLTSILSHLDRLNRKIIDTKGSTQTLESKLLSLGKITLVGGALAGGGLAALSLFKHPLEEAKLFENEITRFAALGFGDAINHEAVVAAKGLNAMGTSSRDALRLLRETTAIMNDFQHAKEVLPIMAKMRFGIESVMTDGGKGEGHGAKFETMFQSAIKVAELRGALIDRNTGKIDIPQFTRTLNMMTQAYVASGGLVKPQDYLAAIKTGGVSAKLMGAEAFFFGLGHFMQESGGSRTGTASMSMFQNWAMGRMSQQVAERMNEMGLLDKSKIHYGKTGHITKVEPMSMVDAKRFTNNPFEWVNNVAVPKLKAKGLTGNDINIGIAQLLGIRTASNLADQFIREQKVAEQYVIRAQRASGIDGLANAGKETLQGKIINLQAKWKDALLELGNTVLPIAIKAVQGLTVALKSVTDLMRNFPTITKALVLGFGVLAGAMTIGGVVMLAAAGFRAIAFALAFTPIGGLAKLPLAASGITGVASAIGVLMKAGNLFAAAYAGWKLGGLINDKVINPAIERATGKKGATLGTAIADMVNPDRGETRLGNAAKIAAGLLSTLPGAVGIAANIYTAKGTGKSPYIAPGADKTVQVVSTINLDGRSIAKVVSEHQAKTMSRPNAARAGFDGTVALQSPGMTSTR